MPASSTTQFDRQLADRLTAQLEDEISAAVKRLKARPPKPKRMHRVCVLQTPGHMSTGNAVLASSEGFTRRGSRYDETALELFSIHIMLSAQNGQLLMQLARYRNFYVTIAPRQYVEDLLAFCIRCNNINPEFSLKDFVLRYLREL